MRVAYVLVASLLAAACGQGESIVGNRGAGVDLGSGGGDDGGSTSDDWAPRERECPESFAATPPTYRSYRMDVVITPTSAVPQGVQLATAPAPFQLIFNETDGSIYVNGSLGDMTGGIGVESLDPLRLSRIGNIPLSIDAEGRLHALELPHPFELATADLDADGVSESYSGTVQATYHRVGAHEEFAVEATIVLAPETGLGSFTAPTEVSPTEPIFIPSDRFVIADGTVRLLVDGVEMFACAGAVNAPLNGIAVYPYQALPWGAELELEVGVVDLEGNASTLDFTFDVVDLASGTPDLGFESGTSGGFASISETGIVDAATGLPMDGQHALIVETKYGWGVGFEVDVPQSADPVLTFKTRYVLDGEVSYGSGVQASAMVGNVVAPVEMFEQDGLIDVLATPLQFPAGTAAPLTHAHPVESHRIKLDGFQGQRAVVWIGSMLNWYETNLAVGNAAIVIDGIQIQ